jgi:hypothetical protein
MGHGRRTTSGHFPDPAGSPGRGAGPGRLSPRPRHPAIDGSVTPPEPPRTAYERLAAYYRRRNEQRHITSGFTAGQRIHLDRVWNETRADRA